MKEIKKWIYNVISVLTAIIILRHEKLDQIEDKRQKKKNKINPRSIKIRKFFYAQQSVFFYMIG